MSRPDRIHRFTRGERALHWLLAATFLAMLATGLVLSVPSLAPLLARPDAKAVHLGAAWALAAGTLALAAVHGRRLLATVRELEVFDRDDLRWLRGVPARVTGAGPPAPPQGRFNAGQKLNTAVVTGLMAVAYVTGGLMWLGERDHAFRFPGTVLVHDWTMYLLVVLVAGHLHMALVNPSTRPALRGMLRGDVDRAWARRHHAKWVARDEDPQGGPPGGRDGGRPGTPQA
ncbi:MAG: cytochrome b/b6 domain-containing protein [Thermoleophilia bacterium]